MLCFHSHIPVLTPGTPFSSTSRKIDLSHFLPSLPPLKIPPHPAHGINSRQFTGTYPWQSLLFMQCCLGFDGRVSGTVREESTTCSRYSECQVRQALADEHQHKCYIIWMCLKLQGKKKKDKETMLKNVKGLAGHIYSLLRAGKGSQGMNWA